LHQHKKLVVLILMRIIFT